MIDDAVGSLVSLLSEQVLSDGLSFFFLPLQLACVALFPRRFQYHATGEACLSGLWRPRNSHDQSSDSLARFAATCRLPLGEAGHQKVFERISTVEIS